MCSKKQTALIYLNAFGTLISSTYHWSYLFRVVSENSSGSERVNAKWVMFLRQVWTGHFSDL